MLTYWFSILLPIILFLGSYAYGALTLKKGTGERESLFWGKMGNNPISPKPKPDLSSENDLDSVYSCATYSGYSLNSAKEAYAKDEMDLETLETTIDLILLEAINPQENKIAAIIPDVWSPSLSPAHAFDAWSQGFLHPEGRTPTAPPRKPKDYRAIMPPRVFGATVVIGDSPYSPLKTEKVWR